MNSSTSRLTTSFLALILITGSIESAAAQSQDSLRRGFETAKRQNAVMRVHTADGVVQGRIPFVYDEDARVGGKRVAYGSIAAVERQHRLAGGARKGALAGGLALGAVGALAALSCDHGCIAAACRQPAWISAAAWALPLSV